MSKENIISKLKDFCSKNEIDITKYYLGKIHDFLMTVIKDELDSIGEIRLYGVGTLAAVTSKEKQCRNPQTGAIMIVPEKRRVKFKASHNLLVKLNEKHAAAG
ncbi:HU family DNA-binding protein [Wolbachia endosymbiont of Ctenocephalides felis wCfeT]|uniref:HU family DNA-binding protein n=1 Tax=Wolbachia endosymbiont of Ctenocephalides felis wCfeT TaxID=2732593 RepID=UPI001445FCE9|nr:HU family DNA-binding protein [Wolbachia endosymbiont of Ctenocephalides felis wCfeT]